MQKDGLREGDDARGRRELEEGLAQEGVAPQVRVAAAAPVPRPAVQHGPNNHAFDAAALRATVSERRRCDSRQGGDALGPWKGGK